MIARNIILFLLLVVLPEVYIYWHYFRRHHVVWWKRALWWLPCVFMLGYIIWLYQVDGFVPSDISHLLFYNPQE